MKLKAKAIELSSGESKCKFVDFLAIVALEYYSMTVKEI